MHGGWQYLRILELVGSIGRHAGFYRRALTLVPASKSAPRILICGSADYSMYALVLDAFRNWGIEPDITAVDTCDTPLELHRWYGRRVSATITTRQCNILDYREPAAFDAICAHAFLGQFKPPGREALFRSWQTLLRPGGVAVTINRIRPDFIGEKLGFSGKEGQAFQQQAVEAWKSRQAGLDMDPGEFETMIDTYVHRHFTYPVTSMNELEGQIGTAGLILDRSHTDLSELAAINMNDGPSAQGGSGHAKIVAMRPATGS